MDIDRTHRARDGQPRVQRQGPEPGLVRQPLGGTDQTILLPLDCGPDRLVEHVLGSDAQRRVEAERVATAERAMDVFGAGLEAITGQARLDLGLVILPDFAGQGVEHMPTQG